MFEEGDVLEVGTMSFLFSLDGLGIEDSDTSEELLFSWLVFLNFELAKKGSFVLKEKELLQKIKKIDFLSKEKDVDNNTFFNIIEWGEKKGLVKQTRGKHYVFPLAKILTQATEESQRIFADILEDDKKRRKMLFQNQSLKKSGHYHFVKGLKIIREENARMYYIIKSRYGLYGSKAKTLQEIGDELDITRERVRQIENRLHQKFKWRKHRELYGKAKEHFIIAFLYYFFADQGSFLLCLETKKRGHEEFLAKCTGVPAGQIKKLEWAMMTYQEDEVFKLFLECEQKLKAIDWKRKKPNTKTIREIIFNKLDKLYLSYKDAELLSEKIFDRMQKNFNTKQRVYLTLQEIGRPAHFREIAQTYGRMWPQNSCNEKLIHNYLINTNKTFGIVWTGKKGVYALEEWGYERPTKSIFDIVAEIVEKKYQETQQPVHISEIKEEAMKYRKLVGKNSISMACNFNPLLCQDSSQYFVPQKTHKKT